MAEQTPDQRDAAKLDHQAHDEHHSGKHGAAGVKKVESKLAKHRDLIIVGLSVLSVVIGYLAWKGKGSGKAAATTSDATAGATDTTSDGTYGQSVFGATGASSGAVAGDSSGTDYSDLTNTLTSALAQQQDSFNQAQADAQDGQKAYFDNLSKELAQLTGAVSHGTGATTATSRPVGFLYGAAAKGAAYFRDPATGTIFQTKNGRSYKLSGLQWAQLGSPRYRTIQRPAKPPTKRKTKKK